MSDKENDSEVAEKVVAIMQTIAEDTEDRRKRVWRKMLGMSDTSASSDPSNAKESVE